jgi:hypothetical protein
MTSTLDPAAPPPAAASSALLPATAELMRLRQRARTGIWIEAIAVVAVLLLAFAGPTFVVDRLLRLEWIWRAILLASFVGVVLWMLRRRLLRPLAVPLSDEEMALAVERASPQVRQALISSLQFQGELASGAPAIESSAMKRAVVIETQSRLGTIPFASAIDSGRVRRYALALLGVIVAFGVWAAFGDGTASLWARRNLLLANVDWPRATTLRLADGGADEVRLPQGDALSLRLIADGTVPDQAFVDYRFANGERGTEPMSRTGEREFTWTIDSVLGDMTLTAEAGDALPIAIRVVVVERPRVDDLAVRVSYPDYMEREPELVPATEGELRLPKGARLAIAGKSQKPLTEAFLLFQNEQKTALPLAADGLAFSGEFAPTASGLLVIDVIDRDRLGAGTPPKLMLRVGDDKPPTLEFRLRGIGSAITAHARIPGELRAKDDFGLRQVSAVQRAILDQPAPKPGPANGDGTHGANGANGANGSSATNGASAPPEVPFTAAVATFGEALEKSARRYETTAAVDLAQWNQVPDENASQNPIRPGMLFSLRWEALDNFGPGEPHKGAGETMTFRVVTRERLVEELRRRQIEQRQELQRLIDDEQRARLELTEMVALGAAGDRRKQAEARLKALARQQQALGRRVAFVGEAYQRILWEYENNRLIEANKVRQLEGLIPVPLAALGKDACPSAARLVDAYATTADEATKTSAVQAYADIERRMQAILKLMEEAESLAALLEELKLVIQLEGDAISDTERRRREREGELFQPKPRQPKDK